MCIRDRIQSARFYKGTVDNNGAVTEADLSFTSFPTVGSVTTYDSTSFCPDSACLLYTSRCV